MPRPRKGNCEKLVPVILDRIASGETLTSIANDLGVHRRRIYEWLAETDQSAQLAYAREAGADALAAQALAIADDGSQDTIETEKGEVCNREWIARSKLRVETRLKLAAVFCPGKYGQNARIEHTGKDGGPIATVTEFVLAPLSAVGPAPS